MVAAILGDTKMRPGRQIDRGHSTTTTSGAPRMDALIAGAGDTKVRAGAMRLLATIPTRQGRATTARRWTCATRRSSAGYEETLTVDAKTGVIEKMVGGDAGKPASVTVTYDIKRVEARDVIG